MGKSAQQPTQQQVTTTTSNLPEYARPYFENLMNRSQAESYREYTPYEGQRIADFNPAQQQVQQQTLGLQQPGQISTATDMATTAGLGALNGSVWNPRQFQADQIGQPNLTAFSQQDVAPVTPDAQSAPQMDAAQTSFGSQPLEQFRMDPAQQFGTTQAQQYMSPYFQQVLDTQKREAVTDAQKAQLTQNLGAARQGTYGGSRQLLATMERERNLGQQLGDIQARGTQAAFENAQQQFQRDRDATLQVGQSNLGAALQQQQLGTQSGLQAALANLSAEQQGRVQNLAAQLQTQGLNADQAMQAALANQQAQLTVGGRNLDAALQTQQLGTQSGLQALLANQQAGLEAQRLSEQSGQFGANLGLQGSGQLLEAGRTLGNLGLTQQQSDLQRLQAQAAIGAQQQGLSQQYLDTAYADFLRQRDYPMEQLGYFSNMLRGLPVQLGSTQTTYAPPPSFASQLGGVGLGALGLYNMTRGG